MRNEKFANEGPMAQSVERLRREFERWIDTAMQRGGRALDAIGLRNAEREWCPLVDVIEDPDQVRVEVELPGVDPSAIEVSLAGNMLSIKGPAQSPVPERGTVHVCERLRGPYSRSLPMPAPVASDSVVAEYRNGVLSLRLRKTQPAHSVKIRVNEPQASSV